MTDDAIVDGRYARGSVSAGQDLHAIEVAFVLDILDNDAERYRLLLTTDAAFTLAGNLLAAIRAATGRQLWDALAGECATCGNTRFVDVLRPGHVRPMREHCPDCIPRTHGPLPAPEGWRARQEAIR